MRGSHEGDGMAHRDVMPSKKRNNGVECSYYGKAVHLEGQGLGRDPNLLMINMLVERQRVQTMVDSVSDQTVVQRDLVVGTGWNRTR